MTAGCLIANSGRSGRAAKFAGSRCERERSPGRAVIRKKSSGPASTSPKNEWRSLRSSLEKRRRRALVQAAGGVGWLARADGAIMDVENAGAQRAPGVTPWGEGWLSWIHPDDRDDALTNWKNAIRDKIPYVNEFRMACPERDLSLEPCECRSLTRQGRRGCRMGRDFLRHGGKDRGAVGTPIRMN